MGLNIGAMLRRLERPDLPRVEVYGDESMDRGPYDVLGSLWIRAEEASLLREELTTLRATVHAPNPQGEVKWTKCSGSGENALFNAFVDALMARIRDERAFYKCIVIERALVDNKAWNDGDEELGFYKAWWTLLQSRVRPGFVYDIRLDARQLQKQHRLATLREVLNNTSLRNAEIDYLCCGSLESRDSKKDDLIQAVDLLTGAVGFHWSRCHQLAGASSRKCGIAARIAGHLGRTNLCGESLPSEPRFNIWKYRPRKR